MQSFIDHFYVCEDLSKLGTLDIQRFATLQEAVAAYKMLTGDKVKALGVQNTLPRPGTLDFVQHLNSKDMLLSDCLRLPAWRNAEIQKIWSELRELLPSVQRRTIRFITPEYKELFALQDGESLKMRYMDGTTKTTPCFACSDGYHFYLGANQLFHICQFAEISRANGIIYMPQTSHEGERADTYEIYQLSRYSAADYRFEGYDYEVAYGRNIKYAKLRPKGSTRAIRFKSLGPGYSEQELRERLEQPKSDTSSRREQREQAVPLVYKKVRFHGCYRKHDHKKITGFSIICGCMQQMQRMHEKQAKQRNVQKMCKNVQDLLFFDTKEKTSRKNVRFWCARRNSNPGPSD